MLTLFREKKSDLDSWATSKVTKLVNGCQRAADSVRGFGDKARDAVLVGGIVLASSAHAAGMDDILDEIDVSGIATKVGSIALVVVGVYLTIQGISVAKRIISKV